MAKEKSLTQLKQRLKQVESKLEELLDEKQQLHEKIEALEEGYEEARLAFINGGSLKIQEELGWTHQEMIEALGGTFDPDKKRRPVSTKRSYVKLIPLDKDGTISESEHIILTPRLGVFDQGLLDKFGLIPLLKHTISETPDEDNRKRAEARLKKEEAKAKK